MEGIYLDNAATSWPKPELVYEAIDSYQRNVGASVSRGAYRSAQTAQRIVDDARASCARLLGIRDPHQLVFTANGTASLNLAIHGLLQPGDHVVTTVCEHNSVLRPLFWQEQRNSVEVTLVGCDHQGYVDPTDIEAAITAKTKLIAITHASNVTGALQSVETITEIAHRNDAYLLLDAAQTAGCVEINTETLGVDLLACGGHKGLLGALGTGLLYVRRGLEAELSPLMQGGSGVNSVDKSPPIEMPARYETGNLSVPAIAGLGAAASYLKETGIAAIHDHLCQLTERLLDGLTEIPGVRIYGPNAEQPRVAVVSCAIEGYDPQEFAAALDASCGIACRAGLHCSPQIHQALGTADAGGLVRFSPGWSTTPQQIDLAVEAVTALAAVAP